MHTRLGLLALTVFLVFLPSTSPAQWKPDGVALSAAANDQLTAAIVSDGAGGAIVAWIDIRSGNNYSDIYAQRIDASGVVQWTVDGVPVCTATYDQSSPTITSDGAGGAIVTWNDYRSVAHIYAQRINASGVVQWTPNGVALCAAAGSEVFPTIVADGAGGAIVTWVDFRNGNYDIYAQRINAAGVPQWGTNAVPLCTAASDQISAKIVSDGGGGAIVTWEDYRSGTHYDVYTQRINAAGAVQWTANGVALCTAAFDQSSPMVVSDAAGGAVVTWHDRRGGTYWDIYAQRINASGVVQWAANGVALSIAPNHQYGPAIASDGAGGAVVTWYDYRSGTNNDIYAQRVNAAGVVQWTADGLALCTAGSDQSYPAIVLNGAGGAIVTWQDGRSGTSNDVYAQGIRASGVVQWTANGVSLCTAERNQTYPAIVSNGAGGAIVTWHDYRSNTSDIYAQRVEGRYGYWGHPEPTITSVADIRADQGGKVKVNWKASDEDVFDVQQITHYSIWRATDVAAALSAAAEGKAVRDPSEVKEDFQGKAVWTQHLSASDYYWEWMGNQSAHYLTAYTFTAPTRADSTSQGMATQYFFVSAHTSDPFVFFDSNTASGHSVDNLAPAAPLMLTAQRVGVDVQLKWNRVRVTDLKNYAIYRATSSGVTPVPINFLSSAKDTVLVDASAPGSALYYIVTAYDVHENQSPRSNEASVGATTNVGNTPAITQLTVLQNYPNPFAGTTELEIGLPAASDIAIEVYDVAGRRVREMRHAGLKGWQKVPFSGVNDSGAPLASGVYFYKVRAGGETVTRKMLIAR